MRALNALLFTAVALVACTDDDVEPPDTRLHLRMTATVPPGAELEYCQFVEIPDTWVTRDTVEFTGESHHVLVYQTPYTAIPTMKDNGIPVDTSGVFDCTDGASNGWSVTKLIGGSQNFVGESFLSFPDGIGLHIGGVVLINVHYVNAHDTPLEADAKIVFDTIPADQVIGEGDILFLYNPLIAIPANGTARAHWQCPVYSDITIANLQSHMHSRGVDYTVRIDNNAPIYTNTRWESVPVRHYDNLTVHAGSKIDYYCDYRNTTSGAIYQGARTTDEMCVLIGSYYPADVRTSHCTDPSGKLPGGDWIGQGTATCQATLDCVQGAQDFHAITDCMIAAKPEVARTSSELLRCFLGANDRTTQCGPQIQACAAQ